MRKVEVQPFNPLWVSKFQVEADNLRTIFGEEIIGIHHLGSTSVPGLSSKPIIDIMPIVLEINRIDEYNEKMASRGFESKGENGIFKNASERSQKIRGDLKAKLAERFPYDISLYIKGKERFVFEIDKQATEWFQNI